jgi:hypothetical protein
MNQTYINDVFKDVVVKYHRTYKQRFGSHKSSTEVHLGHTDSFRIICGLHDRGLYDAWDFGDPVQEIFFESCEKWDYVHVKDLKTKFYLFNYNNPKKTL